MHYMIWSKQCDAFRTLHASMHMVLKKYEVNIKLNRHAWFFKAKWRLCHTSMPISSLCARDLAFWRGCAGNNFYKLGDEVDIWSILYASNWQLVYMCILQDVMYVFYACKCLSCKSLFLSKALQIVYVVNTTCIESNMEAQLPQSSIGHIEDWSTCFHMAWFPGHLSPIDSIECNN